jgi:hypothetical protein
VWVKVITPFHMTAKPRHAFLLAFLCTETKRK